MAGQQDNSIKNHGYNHAWKDAVACAIHLYSTERGRLEHMYNSMKVLIQSTPANERNLQAFEISCKNEITKLLGPQRAQPVITRFDQKLNDIKAVAGNNNRQAQQHQQVQAQHAQQVQAQHAQQVQAQHAQQLQQQQQQMQAQIHLTPQEQQYAQAQQQLQYQQHQYQQQQQNMMQQHANVGQQHQNQQGQQQQYSHGTAGVPNMHNHYASNPGVVYPQHGSVMHNPAAVMNNPVTSGMPTVQMPQAGYIATTNATVAGQQFTGQLPQALVQHARPIHAASPSPAVPPATAAAPQGKPPKPAKGKRAAEGDATTAGGGAGATGAGAGGGAEEGKPAPKRAKPSTAPRKKKAQDSDADEDAADKFIVGDELLVDLQAETDAAMEGIEGRRRRQLTAVPGGQSWDDGYQYLSAWRLTNEVLLQRKEKMPGAVTMGGPAGVVDFLEPSMLRALQLGFTAHAAEVLRRAAHVAKHRASSSAAQRRPEFVASGEDARRGLGEIRRAAEKIAADKAAIEREELMKKAQSKRADEETRERAQKARAEMAGQQQASAANKAIAATLGGGKGAKWSKWSGAGAGPASGAKGKGKGKGDAGSDTPGDGGDGADGTAKKLASSRSRGDLLGSAASVGAGTSADAGVESTDIQLQDLIVALQQDPTYCKSTLLYRLLNGMN